MNVLSLFSGIGGLELGLERAGMTTVGQVEIDPYCQAVLAKHWPEVPRHHDVRTAPQWWTSQPRPPADLICGGFPCQPVSVAGRQRAQADERWLWPHMADVIRGLRPRWVLLENVPGLLVRGMGDVLGDLAALGYDAEWDCIPAAAVGAPHLRDRVFVVAHTERVAVRQQPVGVPRGGRTPIAGADGAAEHLADTPGVGCRQGRTGRSVGDCPDRPTERPQILGDAASGGGRPGLREGRTRQSSPGIDFAKPLDAGWWAAEPDVGRVADGVPARVDRIRALGNAVVPQVAEHIGRMILTTATERGAA